MTQLVETRVTWRSSVGLEMPYAVCHWLWVLAWTLLASGPARGADDWKFDVLHLKSGRSVQGLLVQESAGEVQFKYVVRKPGTPTVVLPETFAARTIHRIERLDTKDREQLVERLETLARERASLTSRLKAFDGKGPPPRLEEVVLRPAPWGKDGKGKGLGYESAYFRVLSNAPENAVQEAAVRLEQIYAAYARFLPPRRQPPRPTTILLPQSWNDYQGLFKEPGRNLLNAAFFDPARNQVVSVYELGRYSDELTRVYQKHQQLLDQLRMQEIELSRVFKGKIPLAHRTRIDEARQSIDRANQKNEADFESATQRLFQPLYHEAFHAYLAGYVYPPGEAELPRWLNEGLAQIFEGVILEAGELRVGHADKERLAQAQTALRKNELVPLAELLRAGPKQFLVIHGSERQTSDRFYLAAWSLAHYLTFDRQLLETGSLDPYTRALHRGSEPLDAFRDLVGQPLPQFEKEYRQYLSRLLPSGTLSGRRD